MAKKNNHVSDEKNVEKSTESDTKLCGVKPHTLFDNLIWLGTEEAAKYLRKTTNAIRIAVHRGQIKCYKWRRRLYFKRDELDRLLESSINYGGI
ncbi:MAG: helix-turn-helix domain-containing protein [Bacteriovoracaceae bacterium]|jgi:excisionase family DNA binding protein|nr:helix-turn-helix domain-containing protein [Bacteriovoracaceae bacterium]